MKDTVGYSDCSKLNVAATKRIVVKIRTADVSIAVNPPIGIARLAFFNRPPKFAHVIRAFEAGNRTPIYNKRSHVSVICVPKLICMLSIDNPVNSGTLPGFRANNPAKITTNAITTSAANTANT